MRPTASGAMVSRRHLDPGQQRRNHPARDGDGAEHPQRLGRDSGRQSRRPLQHGDGLSPTGARDQRSIINIGSIQSFVALPKSVAYTSSKGGVRMLTKALAIEASPLGIRVNSIGPGFTATPLNAKAPEDRGYMANFESRIPLGRIGTPEDIAGPAVFLASDMARYITGVTLPVDGGYLAR